MIELDEFEFPRREHVKIFSRQIRKHCCWVFVCYTVSAVAGAIFVNDWVFSFVSFVLFLLAFLIICPIIYWLQYLCYFPSAKETHDYQKRKWSFDTDKFHIYNEDGSETHFLRNHIVKVNRFGNYYCVWLNKVSYDPILVTAFRSEEDRIRFEKEILGDKFKTNLIVWKPIIIFILVSACLFGLAYTFRLPPPAPPSGRLPGVPTHGLCRTNCTVQIAGYFGTDSSVGECGQPCV